MVVRGSWVTTLSHTKRQGIMGMCSNIKLVLEALLFPIEGAHLTLSAWDFPLATCHFPKVHFSVLITRYSFFCSLDTAKFSKMETSSFTLFIACHRFHKIIVYISQNSLPDA